MILRCTEFSQTPVSRFGETSQNLLVEVAKSSGRLGGLEITASGAVDSEGFTLSVSNDETRPDIAQFEASFDHLGTEVCP